METAGSDARRFFVVPDRSRPLIARVDRSIARVDCSPLQLWPKHVFQPLGVKVFAGTGSVAGAFLG
jgi:hypothetical protein